MVVVAWLHLSHVKTHIAELVNPELEHTESVNNQLCWIRRVRFSPAWSTRSDEAWCWMGLRTGLCRLAKKKQTSTPNWENNFFVQLASCMGGTAMLKLERTKPKLLTQSWKHTVVLNVIVC